MATVIRTIDERQLDQRLFQASLALYDGKRVTLAPGFFRAAGITPKDLMEMLLEYLHRQEVDSCPVVPRQWHVYIDRRQDHTFVINASAR